MLKGNLTIIAAGDVVCVQCDEKIDESTGKLIEKDGLVLGVDDDELPLCWRHVKSFTKLKKRVAAKAKPVTPQFPAMAGNGQD